MLESYPFPIYSGLLEPGHYNKIGTSIWLFLWCISSITKDKEDSEGVTWGIVLGNKPIKLEDLAEQFGVTKKTISRWIEALEGHEYIRVKRAPYGLIFTVRHSKKYQNKKDKNVYSEPIEETKMSTLSEGEETQMSLLEDKNVHSNKDITEIHNVVVITDQNEIIRRASEIEKHFLKRRGKGFSISSTDFEEVKKMVADGIPIDIVKTSIDKSFAEYMPKHAKDEIRNMSYCIPRCYGEWERMKVDKPITDAVPHVSVALGSPRKTKQQQELDDLRRRAEEERKRDQSRSV